jgi:hypothetical protein
MLCRNNLPIMHTDLLQCCHLTRTLRWCQTVRCEGRCVDNQNPSLARNNFGVPHNEKSSISIVYRPLKQMPSLTATEIVKRPAPLFTIETVGPAAGPAWTASRPAQPSASRRRNVRFVDAWRARAPTGRFFNRSTQLRNAESARIPESAAVRYISYMVRVHKFLYQFRQNFFYSRYYRSHRIRRFNWLYLAVLITKHQTRSKFVHQ